MPRLRILAIGGNSELSLASGSQSIRRLSDGPKGGRLGEILIESSAFGRDIEVECEYFSWTGTPRSNTWKIPMPIVHWLGASRVAGAEKRKGKVGRSAAPALLVVGWSNGGDTAYNVAKRLKEVDALITLDPVSCLTSLHWLPFNGTFSKPESVRCWLHAYTTSWGSSYEAAIESEVYERNAAGRTALVHRLDETSKWNGGNLIAAVGGAWNSQPRADANVAVAGNHGHTVAMLNRLTQTAAYSAFLRSL